MQLINLILSALLVAAAQSTAIPPEHVLEARQGDRGSYTVSGLGNGKQAILNAGGNTLDLAIAMLETERMTTDYAYGMILSLGIQANVFLAKPVLQVITKAMTLQTLVFSSRIGACSGSVALAPASSAKARASGTMGPSSTATYMPTWPLDGIARTTMDMTNGSPDTETGRLVFRTRTLTTFGRTKMPFNGSRARSTPIVATAPMTRDFGLM